MPVTLQRQTRGQLTCWHIRSEQAELTVAEQGAQVLEYRQHGQPPLIWLSEQADYAHGVSVRGGVPICWPWFGDLARNPEAVQALHPQPANAPFHGLARNLPWQLDEIALDGPQVVLRFQLARPDLPPGGWPEGLAARFDIRLDDALELNLISHNRGERALTLSQALHSYFAVSDIRQVRVPELAGCRYIETLDDWRETRQSGELAFSGETDRIYLQTPAQIAIDDLAWGRRIRLQSSHSTSAIVWNPWIDKAARLSQFADDAWQRMLCIETANVLEDVVELAPGGEARLGLRISSESRPG